MMTSAHCVSLCAHEGPEGQEEHMAHAEHEMQPANILGCVISENPLDPLLPILSICRQHHPDEDM